MADKTGIEWCDHTFNPWRGCTKVSPGCANCYAETMSRRNPSALGEWGPNGKRVIAAESYWRKPLKWDREAREAGARRKVFCASLADVFEDRPELDEPRERLLMLAYETSYLDWLFLTKRPQNIEPLLRRARHRRHPHTDWWTMQNDSRCRPNWWFGVSAEDQPRWDERTALLRQVPAAVRFVSAEPLLGYINTESKAALADIHWVIIGGESGNGCRPCNVAWVRSLVEQCRAAGVAPFVKQLGGNPVQEARPLQVESGVWEFVETRRLRLKDRKGGDPAEWAEDLRVREFPKEVRADG